MEERCNWCTRAYVANRTQVLSIVQTRREGTRLAGSRGLRQTSFWMTCLPGRCTCTGRYARRGSSRLAGLALADGGRAPPWVARPIASGITRAGSVRVRAPTAPRARSMFSGCSVTLSQAQVPPAGLTRKWCAGRTRDLKMLTCTCPKPWCEKARSCNGFVPPTTRMVKRCTLRLPTACAQFRSVRGGRRRGERAKIGLPKGRFKHPARRQRVGSPRVQSRPVSARVEETAVTHAILLSSAARQIA